MYKVYEEEPWKAKGKRIFSVDNYNVLYIPNKKLKTVNIVRIIYGGRDLPKALV